MSYCRFSEGDVYMYFSVYGYIECCACRASGTHFTVSGGSRKLLPYQYASILEPRSHVPFKNRHHTRKPYQKVRNMTRTELARFNAINRKTLMVNVFDPNSPVRLVHSFNPRHRKFYSFNEALEHLLYHKKLGHKVPKQAITRLRNEIKRNDQIVII